MKEYFALIQGNWTKEEKIGIYAEIYSRFCKTHCGSVPMSALSERERYWAEEFEEHIVDNIPFTEQQIYDWLLGRPYNSN